MFPAAPPPSAPPPRASLVERGTNPLVTAAVVIMVMAGLYVGQEILVPLALAVLLSFILAPLAIRLDRLGLGRVPSVLLVVSLACAIIGGVSILVGSQMVSLAGNITQYRYNVFQKIHSLQGAAPGEGVIGRTSQMLKEIGSELTAQPKPEAQPAGAGEKPREPVPVRIVGTESSPVEVIGNVIGPVVRPIGTAGLVVVFVSFMLLQREDMRNRFIRLISGRDLTATTEALDEAAQRVSRYLVSQLLVNLTYGVPIGLGLSIIGVPNALLWGILATILRFLPYAGPVIAAVMPIALAIAVDPGWTMVAWTVGLFLVIELAINNVVEPWLYGASTGLSSLAVILAAVFWTTLWGLAGLFLSTPLTVCVVVIGRYVPQLEFLGILLGSEPVLSPEVRFYQRMLASDWEEGEDIAEESLNEGASLARLHDEVILPALRLAERDRHRQALPDARVEEVAATVRRVIAELAGDELPPPRIPEADPVLCAGGRTALDQMCGELLAQLLERNGVPAHVLPPGPLEAGEIARLRASAHGIVVLSYLGAGGVAQARQACRRLRRRVPDAFIIAGFWNQQIAPGTSADAAAEIGANLAAASLQEAVEQVSGKLMVGPAGGEQVADEESQRREAG